MLANTMRRAVVSGALVNFFDALVADIITHYISEAWVLSLTLLGLSCKTGSGSPLVGANQASTAVACLDALNLAV